VLVLVVVFSGYGCVHVARRPPHAGVPEIVGRRATRTQPFELENLRSNQGNVEATNLRQKFLKHPFAGRSLLA
jgi:hypothetical protein